MLLDNTVSQKLPEALLEHSFDALGGRFVVQVLCGVPATKTHKNQTSIQLGKLTDPIPLQDEAHGLNEAVSHQHQLAETRCGFNHKPQRY